MIGDKKNILLSRCYSQGTALSLDTKGSNIHGKKVTTYHQLFTSFTSIEINTFEHLKDEKVKKIVNTYSSIDLLVEIGLLKFEGS